MLYLGDLLPELVITVVDVAPPEVVLAQAPVAVFTSEYPSDDACEFKADITEA